MARILAAAIVLGGLAALAWVGFGGGAESSTVTDGPADAVAVPAESVAEARGESDGKVSVAPTPEPFPEPENLGPRMDLVDLDGWLQTDATSLDDFDGKVLLIEMWTFGCSNCKARIPFNQSYLEEFGGDDFEIIGVHAPEFSFEADVANIQEALGRLDVSWPQALDTSKRNFHRWQPGSTGYWPRTYVIDQNGDIRYDHIGEGKYEELRETLRWLIENPPPPAAET